MSVRFATIADDFTGGPFVASNLERRGIPVLYVSDPAILPTVAESSCFPNPAGSARTMSSAAFAKVRAA